MADAFVRQDGAGTLAPDKRRVSTQDINNLRKFINESVDERIHELIGQKHAVIRGGNVTVNGGDNTKFDLDETFAGIHGQRIKVPAQVALTPGGVAATRFVILRYNLNGSREVIISATPFDLDNEDGFALEVRDSDAGVGEIRLATLSMSGAQISTVVSNLNNLRVDIPGNSRILTVNTGEVKSIINIETGDSRYGQLLNSTANDLGSFKGWPGMIAGALNFEFDIGLDIRVLPLDTEFFGSLFRTIQIGSTPAQAGLTMQTEGGALVPPTYDDELVDPVRTGIGSELKSMRAIRGLLWDVETPSAMATVGDANGFRYRIEGNYLQMIFGKTIVVSWWVKPSISGTFSFVALRGDNLRSFIREWVVTPGEIGLWTRKQVSIPLNDLDAGWDFSTGIGLDLFWMLGANLVSPGFGIVASQAEVDAEVWINRAVVTGPNQTNLFSAIGQEMEMLMFSNNPGSVFDFQTPSVPEDLNLINRYIEDLRIRHADFANNAITLESSEAFKQQKRIIPNNTISVDSSSGTTAPVVLNDRTDIATIQAEKNGNGGYVLDTDIRSDARL